MRVEYHPRAAEDLNDAVAYYNELRAGLGDAMRLEVYAVIDRIVQFPERHRVVEGEIRRCLVHRFPFSVLYRLVGSDVVRILVIRHHRRDPGFGLRRK
jgi:plasmid stabilization system protein ParE